jgi:hypothetical protein
MTAFAYGNGVMQPEELAAMRDVFDDVASQPWFSRDPSARKSFAKYLLENFPDGSYDPVMDRPLIEASARKFFSRQAWG